MLSQNEDIEIYSIECEKKFYVYKTQKLSHNFSVHQEVLHFILPSFFPNKFIDFFNLITSLRYHLFNVRFFFVSLPAPNEHQQKIDNFHFLLAEDLLVKFYPFISSFVEYNSNGMMLVRYIIFCSVLLSFA